MNTTADLTARDACLLADVTYRQVDYWSRLGLIRPDGRDTPGSGNRRTFTAEDIFRLRLAKVMVSNHLDHDVIRQALDLAVNSPAAYLWVQEDTVGLGTAFDLLDAMAHVRATLVVNLSPLRAGLDLPR